MSATSFSGAQTAARRNYNPLDGILSDPRRWMSFFFVGAGLQPGEPFGSLPQRLGGEPAVFTAVVLEGDGTAGGFARGPLGSSSVGAVSGVSTFTL